MPTQVKLKAGVKNFKSLLLRKFENITVTTKKDVTAKRKAAELAKNRYLSAVVSLAEAEKLLEVLDRAKDDDVKWVQDQLEMLSTHKKIKSFGVADDKFWFKTHRIYITHPKTQDVYDIGDFVVRININLSDPAKVLYSIKFTNTTRKVHAFSSSMHHPHIFKKGEACFGSAVLVLTELFGRMEYAAAASYIVAFLESVNINDSAGEKVDRWPKLTASQITALKEAKRLDKIEREKTSHVTTPTVLSTPIQVST